MRYGSLSIHQVARLAPRALATAAAKPTIEHATKLKVRCIDRSPSCFVDRAKHTCTHELFEQYLREPRSLRSLQTMKSLQADSRRVCSFARRTLLLHVVALGASRRSIIGLHLECASNGVFCENRTDASLGQFAGCLCIASL